MGHHSIAEHANLNFDILDISRLALEELEARRIGSAYTEKSQRYITLEGDYYLPKEFDSKDKEKFEDLIKTQNDFYFKSLDKLIEYQYKENPELARKARIAEEKGTSNLMNRAKNAIEGWAKEDARYALSLATEGQVGVTFNARTLEHAIRSMRNSELSETKELSEKLFDEAKEVVPSLIRLANAEEYKKEYGRELEDDNYKYTREEIKGLVERFVERDNDRKGEELRFLENGNTKLITKTEDIDLEVITAIMHMNSNEGIEKSYQRALEITHPKTDLGKRYIKQVLKHISEYDSLPREFEFPNLKYELIVSASNFAQLKRHRMMTLLSQDYNPELGYTIPESIKAIGMEEELKKVLDKSTELFKEFKNRYGKTAEYCLTNAHKRRVLISVNPRELYHISRLRMDGHAQWDIRNTANEMIELGKEYAPATFILAGGKDQFKGIKKEVYKDF
jgi:flavin-dependent thymidylate synthase